MKDIDLDPAVQFLCRVVAGDATAFRLDEGGRDVEFCGEEAGYFMGASLGQIFIVCLGADVVGEAYDADLFYTRTGEEGAVALQGIGVLDEVFIEVELDVVYDDGVGRGGRRDRSVRGIDGTMGFGSEEGIGDGIILMPPGTIGGG